MENRETPLCPAARCEPGARLLGVVQPSGRVAFLPAGGRVDEEFSQLATTPGSSKVRFRYSSPCLGSACLHCQGQRCTAVDEVRAHLAPFAQTTAPSCSIRPQCRWHQQAGDAACAVCPLVITDLMAVETDALLLSSAVSPQAGWTGQPAAGPAQPAAGASQPATGAAQPAGRAIQVAG